MPKIHETGKPLYVERFGPEDYDRHEQNWMIRQSPAGLIYVANRTGLLEYDGRTWTSTPFQISLRDHLR
jgi:hypothetical protein